MTPSAGQDSGVESLGISLGLTLAALVLASLEPKNMYYPLFTTLPPTYPLRFLACLPFPIACEWGSSVYYFLSYLMYNLS